MLPFVAKMITIQQWCAAIGSFQRTKCNRDCNDDEILIMYDDMIPDACHTRRMKFMFMSIIAMLTVIISFLLLRSGDIESNPGPGLYILCPVCNQHVHVRKTACSCGWIVKNKTAKGGYKKVTHNLKAVGLEISDVVLKSSKKGEL